MQNVDNAYRIMCPLIRKLNNMSDGNSNNAIGTFKFLQILATFDRPRQMKVNNNVLTYYCF